MRSDLILPTVLVFLNVACSVAYAAKGDFRRAIYWAASSILISAVTY